MNAMEDTMLMSYVLDAGKNRHNMDVLSKVHLDHKTITFKDIVGTGKKQINFSEVKIDIAKDYAAEDADLTFRLYKIFSKNIKLEKLINIYEIFEKPLIKILALMEIYGVKVDQKFLQLLSSKFEKKINNLEKNIYKLSKKEFKIASTKQLGEVMYNEMKISSLKKTKNLKKIFMIFLKQLRSNNMEDQKLFLASLFKQLFCKNFYFFYGRLIERVYF